MSASGIVSMLIYYQCFDTKQRCSSLILRVPARLLGSQHIFESHSGMAYVVRLILIMSILSSIRILGLYFYPLKVRQHSTTAADT
jgi:hypothetical protein